MYRIISTVRGSGIIANVNLKSTRTDVSSEELISRFDSSSTELSLAYEPFQTTKGTRQGLKIINPTAAVDYVSFARLISH